MKQIIEVFKNDVTKIWGTKIAVVILIGLLIIPGIYAWLNIDSNWNPYDNTSNLPIAIVNKDEGITMLGEELNMGELLEENLKSNTAMKWIFTDEEDGRTNVDKSKYYGMIIIPEDFSSKIATLFDDSKIQKPEFDFYVNEKKNPIAPIIVNKAVGTIQTNLNQAFVNAVVYNVVDKAEEVGVVTKGNSTTQDVITKLNNVKSNVEGLRNTLKTISLASNSASNALEAVKDLLPTINNVASTSSSNISEMKDVITEFNNIYTDVNNSIGLVFESAEALGKNIQDIVNSIKPSDDSSTEITNVTNNLDGLKTMLTEMKDTLDQIDSELNIASIEQLKTKINEALDTINEIQKGLPSNGNISQEDLNNLKTSVANLNSTLTKAKNDYNNTVKPALDKAFSNASTSMNNITKVVSNLNTSLGKTDTAMGHMISALGNTEELTENIDASLVTLEENIDTIIASLGGATESELYLKIVNLLQNDPNDVADFISTPIETNEIDVYTIDSYGSKMAPFYTVLASWVGCTLLVSILKTDVKKSKKLENIKPYQAFLGRFMLFGMLAMLQGLVIAIGDIILGIQVINYPLFILTEMLASLVFMLIVYSLTISFGKVGEATAVVIMVLQVAGSGGTFPIELLPRFFQVLQPFMPFYPAMNALRETIGGFYGNSYICYILALLCHMIIPLLIGLVWRKPIIHIKEKLSKKLEKTDIIV